MEDHLNVLGFGNLDSHDHLDELLDNAVLESFPAQGAFGRIRSSAFFFSKGSIRPDGVVATLGDGGTSHARGKHGDTPPGHGVLHDLGTGNVGTTVVGKKLILEAGDGNPENEVLDVHNTQDILNDGHDQTAL